jgi:hypothetical protein
MRVNVSQRNPDKVVQEVLDRLARPSLVDGPLGSTGVQGVVDDMFRAPGRPGSFCLDVIAHSRAGVLHLGGWAVDGNAPTQELRAACAETFAHMPLREIRLLGCNTAVKAGGRNAMRRLAEIFGARVWGTKVPISAQDFDRDAFRSTGLLADHHDIARFAMPTAQHTARWFSGLARVQTREPRELAGELRDESEAEALDDWHRADAASRWTIRRCSRPELEALFDHARPGMASVPGILALPELEIVAPIGQRAGRPLYHRVTVLLDGELVRVYPRASPGGCVFRVRRGPAWDAALGCGAIIR